MLYESRKAVPNGVKACSNQMVPHRRAVGPEGSSTDVEDPKMRF